MTIPLFSQKSFSLSVIVLSGAIFCFSPVYAQEVMFDTDMLKARGINPDISTYFATEPRFLPGKLTVMVRLNGRDKGSIPARFGAEGEWCADADFLARVGLKAIPEADKAKTATTQCLSYAEAYPGTMITLSPNNGRVEIIAPPEALLSLDQQSQDYSQGGRAGSLNYSLFSMQNQFYGRSTSHSQGSFELGLNLDDWVIRSRQMVTVSDGGVANNALYTYAQRTLPSIGMMMQAGQINMSNTLFAGAPITGVQLIPVTELVNEGSGVTITGIAQTAQARVDIRQSGVLIYSSLVSAGFFTLLDVPVISRVADLTVTVAETNGQQNTFTVSSSTFADGSMGRPEGLSFALGQVRQVTTTESLPMVGTVSNGWRLSKWANASTGAIASRSYQSVGGQFDVMPAENVTVSSGILGSSSQNAQGSRMMLSARYQAPYRFTINTSMSQNSAGYRELLDSITQFDNDYAIYHKNEYNASVGWSHPMVGGLYLGYSRNTRADGVNNTQRLVGSWGKSFGKISMSVNWQHQISNSFTKNNSGDSLFINASMPIGTHRARTYIRNSDNRTLAGVGISGNLSDDISYSLATEHDKNNPQSNLSGGANINLHYTQLGLNASQSNNNSRSYSATLNGGIAAHQQGITFSPHTLRETFAIVSLNNNINGVAINTPQGKVWTDFKGQAVIPSLTPYRVSQVEVDVKTLPKNADIDNGIHKLTAGYGAVAKLNFNISNTRRVMLNVTFPEGKTLGQGIAIIDGNGSYVSTVVSDGLVFINDLTLGSQFFALTDNQGHQCHLNYTLPAQIDLDAYYETLDAVCQPEEK